MEKRRKPQITGAYFPFNVHPGTVPGWEFLPQNRPGVGNFSYPRTVPGWEIQSGIISIAAICRSFSGSILSLP